MKDARRRLSRPLPPGVIRSDSPLNSTDNLPMKPMRSLHGIARHSSVRAILLLLAALTVSAIGQTTIPTPTKTARAVGAIAAFPGGDFEQTSIITWQVRPGPSTGTPAWLDWQWSGNAGISKDTSGYAYKNRPVPQGVYVAYLQAMGNMWRTHTFTTAGTYRLRWKATQRIVAVSGQPDVVNRQSYRVLVGAGAAAHEVFEEETAGAGAWVERVSRPFTVNAPTAVEMRWAALNPLGGDHTVLLDDIRLEPVGEWNNTTTWAQGAIPIASDDVSIPSGIAVALRGMACVAGTVNVQGDLLATNQDTKLTARWVMIDGAGSSFQVGTPGSPFQQEFTLELTGDDVIRPGQTVKENINGAGTKFLMVMMSGIVQMHGTPQVSWTRLAATTTAGVSTSITLAQPVGWRVGDRIVIAPSALPNATTPHQAEVRTIAAVSADQLTITLGAALMPDGSTTPVPLAYRHYGGPVQTYTRPSDGRQWLLDERAEVGLLSHNIKIQGDAASEASGFGGHVMAMLCPCNGTFVERSGLGYFSNVEFYRLGQKSKLGRYPMHWHMLKEYGAGQYMIDCAVYRSYNRAITIHGTESTIVDGNVCYDHVGHGFFLEDGTERYNQILNNLVFGTRRPPDGEEVAPTDNSHDELQNRSPSSFWITNPNNFIEGNVAAGTVGFVAGKGVQGTGYWFALPKSPIGLSASVDTISGVNRFSGQKPYQQPLGSFRGNTAHSCSNGFDSNDSVNSDHTLATNVGWDPPSLMYMEDNVFYTNSIAIYSGIGNNETNYRNNVTADNGVAFFVAAPQTLRDSLLVAESGSAIAPIGSVRSAYGHYDGPGRMRDCYLFDFNREAPPLSRLIRYSGAAKKNTNHRFSGLTYGHAGPPRSELPNFIPPADVSQIDFTNINSSYSSHVWAHTVLDEDGTLNGTANTTLIGNHPFMTTSGDTNFTNWVNTFVSQKKFAFVLLDYNGSVASLKDATITREGGGEPGVVYIDRFKVMPWHQFPAIVSQGFDYRIEYPNGKPGSKHIEAIVGQWAGSGDQVILYFSGFANLPGLSTGSGTPHTSLASLRASSSNGVFKDTTTGNLWIKFVRPSSASSVTRTIRWN